MHIHSVSFRVLTAAAAFTFTAEPHPALACGPDFPTELLTSRSVWMSTFPRPDFALSAMKLVPRPAGKLLVVEAEEPKDAREGGSARERALYAEGAEQFKQGNEAAARAAFEKVLALPAGERKHFSTFAAYMLGRLGCQDGRWFKETRKLADAGFDDPLGLAVASFGEEARRRLDPIAYTCAGDEAQPRDDTGAVRLYAQQAAAGSQSGATSLLFVARALARDPERLGSALSDPLVQRVLVLYTWTRIEEDFENQTDARADVDRTLAAIGALPKVADADRLAIALWRAGRFDLAERFAKTADTPLASWVRAKAALRRGDRGEAEKRLAEAAAGIPEDEIWGEPDWQYRPPGRILGERAALALARDDPKAAFRLALASGYLMDILYVSERVLTVDELRDAVDSGLNIGNPPTRDRNPQTPYPHIPVDARLVRAVLARRLMRAGRGEKALAYFDDPKVAPLARRYVEALARSRKGPPAERANALFQASQLARWRGMELLGTDLAPDGGVFAGDYPVEITPAILAGEKLRPEKNAWPVLEWRGRTPLVGREEVRRFAASAPTPDVRFHYRETAADEAEAAAALVPRRSQAYAALLCHAAHYIRFIDEPRYRRLWRTYLKRARSFPFATDFGGKCPPPELGLPTGETPGPAEEPTPPLP